MGETTLYELLEVSHSATPEEIEASYQRLSGAIAPDSLAMYAMLDDGEADRMRAQVEEAYRTLSDPDRRAEYDRTHPADRAKQSRYPDVMLPESANNTSMSIAPLRRERDERAPERDYNREARDERNERSERDYAREARDERDDRGDREHAREARDERMDRSERDYPRETRDERPERDYPRDDRAPERYREEPRASAQAPVASSPVTSDDSEATLVAPRASSRAPQPSVSRKGRLLQPSFGIEVTSDTECSGSLLRRLRESANADLDAVAEITKISKRYLHALEENDFDTLPAAVYVRGFVSEYARALGLDPKLVAKSYMSLYKRYRGEGA